VKPEGLGILKKNSFTLSGSGTRDVPACTTCRHYEESMPTNNELHRYAS
jgi:hypothetical protein